MNKFFKTNSQTYEDIRNKMNIASGYPSSEATTWFCSSDTAPKDSEGNVYIAAIEEISEQFIKAGATEITKEEYISSIQSPENELENQIN